VVEIISGGKSPRAASVQRLNSPERLQGIVKSFDSVKGWGFIERGQDLYFLHRSDLAQPFTPVIGSTVVFYAGTKKGRPRACYVARPHG
jgi:cold shock CspA family protein